MNRWLDGFNFELLSSEYKFVNIMFHLYIDIVPDSVLYLFTISIICFIPSIPHNRVQSRYFSSCATGYQSRYFIPTQRSLIPIFLSGATGFNPDISFLFLSNKDWGRGCYPPPPHLNT